MLGVMNFLIKIKFFIGIIIISFFNISHAFAEDGFLNSMIKDGYKIIYTESPNPGQFSFVLEHKKSKHILICSSVIADRSVNTETVCGEP